MLNVASTAAAQAKTLATKILRARETRRSAWALVDQGLSSIGNFVTLILMARTLSQKDYGTFGILIEVMLFLNSLQAALVIYPMTVKGAAADNDRLKRIAGAALVFTLLLAVPLGLGMVVATKILSHLYLATLAVAAELLWQTQETLRRVLLAHFRYKQAVWGDALSYLGQAAVLLALAHAGRLTIASGLAAMALTSTLAAIVQAIQIGVRRVRLSEVKLLANDFWSIGRWAAGANLASVLTDFSFSWVLAASQGVAVVAVFQVVGNLMRLMNPIISSISGLITPAASQAMQQAGLAAAWRATMRYAALSAAMLGPYFLIVFALPYQVIRIVYGSSSPYLHYTAALRVGVLASLIGYLTAIVGTFLAAVEKSRHNFQISTINICAVLLIGLPMTIFGGLMGSLWACTICVAVRLVAGLYFLRHVHAAAADSPAIPPPDPTLPTSAPGLSQADSVTPI